MSKQWVEINPATGKCVRIFRNKKAAALYYLRPSHGLTQPCITQMEKAEAVHQIRSQVFENDGYTCVKCGKMVTSSTGEMDEREARGRCVRQPNGTYQSGEVSVVNCQTLCRNCHTGPGGKHDRSPSFTKSPQ